MNCLLTPLLGPMCCSAIPRKFCSGVFPPAQRHTAVMSSTERTQSHKLALCCQSDVYYLTTELPLLTKVGGCLSRDDEASAHSTPLQLPVVSLCSTTFGSTYCIISSFCLLWFYHPLRSSSKRTDPYCTEINVIEINDAFKHKKRYS